MNILDSLFEKYHGKWARQRFIFFIENIKLNQRETILDLGGGTGSYMDRFEFIYTPKHGSWLNMAEIELHVLDGQCLNRHISTMEKIKDEVEAWKNNRNNNM